MRRRIAPVVLTTALVLGAAAVGGVAYAVGSTPTTQAPPHDRTAVSAAAVVSKPVVHRVGAAGEPPYLDGFRAYNGPPFGNLSFYKDSSNTVHLMGLACLQNGNLCAVQTMVGGTRQVFRLPLAFRPVDSHVFTGLSVGLSDNYYNPRIDVTNAGYVQVIAPPSAGMDWISFDGISFLAR